MVKTAGRKRMKGMERREEMVRQNGGGKWRPKEWKVGRHETEKCERRKGDLESRDRMERQNEVTERRNMIETRKRGA